MTRNRWLQRAWWRYLQARWGYSTAIHSWELLNEGDPGHGGHFALTDELGQYMHCEVFGQTVIDGQKCTFNHPNDHLVSTSMWHSFPKTQFWANANFPNVDFADIHQYISKDGSITQYIPSGRAPVHYFDTVLATSELSLSTPLSGTGKPIVRGETGFTDNQSEPATFDLLHDKDGIWLHNMIWAGVNHGGLYDAGNWYPGTHIHRTWNESIPGTAGSQPPAPYETCSNNPTFNSNNNTWRFSCSFDHRPHFKDYFDFINNIPVSNGQYSDLSATVSDPAVGVYGQKDMANKRAHVWIQNSKHTWCAAVGGISGCPTTWDNSRLNGTVTITGFAPTTQYPIEWWQFDTNASLTKNTATIISNANGDIVLDLVSLPATIVDVGVKIGDYSNTTPTPTPSGTPVSGDVNGDGEVTIADLSILLANFGGTEKTRGQGDVSGNDGMVNIADLSTLLANFGN